MQTIDMPAGETYLAPIEHPRGAIMKLVYAMTRRQGGEPEPHLTEQDLYG